MTIKSGVIEPREAILTIVLILIVGFALPIMLPQANAQVYYNWVNNDGFEDIQGEEYFENGNLELGSTFPTYFTIYSGTPVWQTSAYFSSTHSLGGSSCSWVYNFTQNVSTAIITQFGFWSRGTATTTTIYIYYSDGTDENSAITLNTAVTELGSDGSTWYYCEIPDTITLDEGKYISAMRLLQGSSARAYDDFTLKSVALGQNQILGGGFSSGGNPIYGTLPWFDSDYLNLHEDENYQEITTELSHSGNYSLRLNATANAPWSPDLNLCFEVYQEFYFLPVSMMHEFSFWVASDELGANRIFFGLKFADGSSSEVTVDVILSTTWQKVNALYELNNLINYQDKSIVSIYFSAMYSGKSVYFDDFTISSELEVGQLAFDWYLSPSPYQYGNTEFTSLFGKSYVFYGTIYDFTGGETENGTAQITMIGISYQTVTVDVINGNFAFNITARPISLFNLDEIFDISATLDTRSFSISITAHWLTTTSTPTPIPTSTDDIWTPDDDSGFISGGLIGGLVITLVFTLLFGYYAHRDGIFAGLMLGTFISGISGLFPAYSIILSIIFGALLIVSHVGFPTGGGTQ